MTNPISSHNGQLEIWRDPSRFKVAVCGRRWGKTVLMREMLLSKSERPRSCNVYVAPTRFQAKDVLWAQLKDRIRELGWGVRINEAELKITRRNKATIELKSAEKPGRLRGRGINFIALDEFAEYRTDEIWREVVRPALSDTRGHAFFGMTPKGFNHAYDLFNKAKTERDWNAFSFKTLDSPFFQTAEGIQEIEDAKRNLTERDFRQEYEASFENFAGRIYYAFDRSKCHTDYKFDSSLPIIIGQDFNRSPMSSCLFQKVGDKLIQFGEIFLTASNTDEVCRMIRAKYSVPVIFRPDATGSRRTSNSAQSDHEIIRSYGFSIQVAATNPKKVDRWASVNRAFEQGKLLINTKECPKTTKDLEVLCYKEGSCEPMLTDPMIGHLGDAHGYAVFKEFPIMGKVTQSRFL